jgi:hypothetical protein
VFSFIRRSICTFRIGHERPCDAVGQHMYCLLSSLPCRSVMVTTSGRHFRRQDFSWIAHKLTCFCCFLLMCRFKDFLTESCLSL